MVAAAGRVTQSVPSGRDMLLADLGKLSKMEVAFTKVG